MFIFSEDLDNLDDIYEMMASTSDDKPSVSEKSDENNVPKKKSRKARSKEEIQKEKVTKTSKRPFYHYL